MPQDVVWIINTLNNHGFEGFIVGGCVRDFLMGKRPKDWDMATSALPTEMKKLFPHTFDTGILHGTITVMVHQVGYEVTTYRIDGDYTDNRHPDNVSFTKELIEDLRRRDFTMNAIAYHESVGYVDPFGGMADIKKGVIRGVGEAHKRFQEDALRMLRAVRFCAQLGFTIEEATLQALKDNAPLIAHVSIERVRDEMLKTLLTGNPSKFGLFSQLGLLAFVYKPLETHVAQTFHRVVGFVGKCPPILVNRLSLLLMDMEGQQLKATLKFLRLDNKTMQGVLLLVSWLGVPVPEDGYHVRKMIGTMGSEQLTVLCDLKAIVCHEQPEQCAQIAKVVQEHEAILARGDCCTLKQLAMNGEQLIAMGVPKGKAVGDTLHMLLEHVCHVPEDNTFAILKKLVL